MVGRKRNEEEEEEEEEEEDNDDDNDDDDENKRRRYATASGFGRKTPKSITAIIVMFSVSIVALFKILIQ